MKAPAKKRAPEAISFEVPRLPVPCPRPRVKWNGAVYYGSRYDAWRIEVGWMAKAALDGGKMLEGDLRLSVNVYGSSRRGDGDNILKGIADAMQGIVYADDKRIRDWRIRLHDGTKADRGTEIEVEELA